MPNLQQVWQEMLDDVYILTEEDKAFIASFGSPGKPVGLAEFLIFWNSLSEQEKHDVRMDYEPGVFQENAYDGPPVGYPVVGPDDPLNHIA